MRIWNFFENWFLRIFLCRFIFGRHALFKEEFANKDLSAIGEIENTAQFIFDPENEDWKWAPAREKTSEDMKARNQRARVGTILKTLSERISLHLVPACPGHNSVDSC